MNMPKKTAILAILISFLTIAFRSQAATICAIGCSDGSAPAPAPAEDPRPVLASLSPVPGLEAHLTLASSGLILLERSVFDGLENLVISPDTDVFFDLELLPDHLSEFDLFRLGKVQFGGRMEIAGFTDELLLYGFSGSDSLDLSSTSGILVLDSVRLTTVPLPVGLALFMSGLCFMSSVAYREKNHKLRNL